jgi:hypothetical protein
LQESPQRTEDVVADGVLPTHEEPLGMAELLEGTMVALDAPVLTLNVAKEARMQCCWLDQRQAAKLLRNVGENGIDSLGS